MTTDTLFGEPVLSVQTRYRTRANGFFVNYQQHKVGISAKYFFPVFSFDKFIVVANKFDGNATKSSN